MFTFGRRAFLSLFGAAPAASMTPGGRIPRAPVRLLFTRVNGERYYDAPALLASLAEGQPVRLAREPGNAFDRRAIEVFAADGSKLGYVARIDNSAVARMMDAGERFTARIARLDRAAMDIRLSVEWLPG